MLLYHNHNIIIVGISMYTVRACNYRITASVLIELYGTTLPYDIRLRPFFHGAGVI
jgi:hypothetical protein